MTTCPRCKAENRPEAAFCSRCGMILFAQAGQTKPFVDEPVPAGPSVPESTPADTVQVKPAEQSVFLTSLPRRMEGAIFGERFKYDALIYQDEHETHYTVTEICKPESPCVRICLNPACRTIHAPIGESQEGFCTVCGSALDQNTPLLMLEEADNDRFAALQPVIDLRLAHPNIHPPISTFQQELPGGIRYCLVKPYSQEIPSHPEVSSVLEWGLELAEGLDYLHAHGMAFGEALDPACFGLAEDRAVWRNFNDMRILPMLTDREKINNVRQLTLNLYAWITGKATYSPDPALNPRLNNLFERALIGEGFTSGASLAHEIEQTIKTGISPLNIDYQVGRRSHAGERRDKNEDSLLCLGLSRIINGISQPAGIFAIADGMGGHATGELASSMSIQTITQKASKEIASLANRSSKEYIEWLKEAVQAANQAVYESRQSAGTDMGSTLVCTLLLGSQAYIANVGDSRLYLVREDSIQQLTIDHSLVQHMVSMGEINSDDARYHPQRNVIYRSLGDKPQADIDVYIQNLQPNDWLLLCSDGCSSMLDDHSIQQIILEACSPQVACDRLIESANLAGGEDNNTVILIKVIAA